MKKGFNPLSIIGPLFTIIGVMFSIVGTVAGIGMYRNGGTVVVNGVPRYYEPGQLAGPGLLFFAIFGGLGIVFLIVGVICIMLMIKRVKEVKHLLEEGSRITARVVSIDRNINIRVNRVHPYFLQCQYEDPYTGKINMFKSDDFMTYPGDIVGMNIDIYVDRNDWNKYVVDTSSVLGNIVYH